MAPACPPALQLLAVTARVLELGPLLAAGDVKAAAEVEALAALLDSPPLARQPCGNPAARP